MSYTIALVATDDTEYINCVKAISDESLLCALPYINIAEFDANHSQLEQIIDFLNNNIKITPQPQPDKLVYTKDKDNDNTYWINIKIVYDKELKQLNNFIADLFSQLDIEPLTPMRQQYNPHLKLTQIINLPNTKLQPLKQTGLDITSFILKLGINNQYGLLGETIAEFNIHENFKSKRIKLGF